MLDAVLDREVFLLRRQAIPDRPLDAEPVVGQQHVEPAVERRRDVVPLPAAELQQLVRPRDAVGPDVPLPGAGAGVAQRLAQLRLAAAQRPVALVQFAGAFLHPPVQFVVGDLQGVVHRLQLLGQDLKFLDGDAQLLFRGAAAGLVGPQRDHGVRLEAELSAQPLQRGVHGALKAQPLLQRRVQAAAFLPERLRPRLGVLRDHARLLQFGVEAVHFGAQAAGVFIFQRVGPR